MEIETMNNNFEKEFLLEEKIPFGNSFKTINEVIDEKTIFETTERLNQEKDKIKYENVLAPQAKHTIDKYLKEKRPKEEKEFYEMKNIIKNDNLDIENLTENIDFSIYQLISKGDYNNKNDIKKNLSKIRGIFAQASQKLTMKIKESISSKDLYDLLFTELFNKKREDYLYLVWQS